jgi:hypothetical protein
VEKPTAEVGDMITNEHRHQQTRTKFAELNELITAVEAGDAGDDEFRDVQLAGLRSQADDLRREITEYETQILAAARRGELGEGRDAGVIRAHASRLRDS